MESKILYKDDIRAFIDKEIKTRDELFDRELGEKELDIDAIKRFSTERRLIRHIGYSIENLEPKEK